MQTLATETTPQIAREATKRLTREWVAANVAQDEATLAHCLSVRCGRLTVEQLVAVNVALRAATDVLTAHGLQGIVTADLGTRHGTFEIDNF